MWRIYYADREPFSSEDGSPFDAPARGVLAILDVHAQVMTGFDFYWWAGEEWIGGDIFGLWDYLAAPGLKTVKFGRTVPDSQYREAVDKAIAARKAATRG